jgi:outer membrane receptor protein involved in Fe transport
MKFNFILLFVFFINMFAVAQQQKGTDSAAARELDEVIITANRKKEKLLQASVTVEKLSYQTIKESAQPDFFNAIQQLKGIHVITPSLGFKVINSRGFANTTNVRFVQMVDGADNQAPHIGAPIGNSIGPNDLDILKVEIIPGPSSAIYGMNAINGIANFITKDAFAYQGISLSQQSGLNNNNSKNTSSTFFSETNLRIAKAFTEKWAFKINGTFMKGTNWYADNYSDLNTSVNTSAGITDENNPGSDRVNIYGDEQGNSKTVTLANKQIVVSRTGYAEKDVADNGFNNLKADATIYYRPSKNTTLSYTFRLANQSNIYQRTNRFRFDNYQTRQQVINFASNSIQLKTYLTTENTGNSYNIRSMAENIDRSFKTDNIWFADFTKQFNTSATAGKTINEALAQARNFADEGRLQPGTIAFKNKIAELRKINNWDKGAALQVKAKLYHIELQHDVTSCLLKKLKEKYALQLMYGFDYRNYRIIPDGNYFINPTKPGNNLNYWKTGGFLQANKAFINNTLKINVVVRMDKNQYYSPKINPRLAVVYSPTTLHNFRASIQNGYRFPSIFEAFSNINSGGRKRIGGLPIMSNGIFENSYTQSSITLFQTAVQTDVNQNGLSLSTAISKNQNALQKNTYTYLQPEKVTSFEIGYRTELLNKRLNLDVDFYYNNYKNLIAQIDANVPQTTKPDSIATYLQNPAKQDRYRLWTNSKTISNNYGSSIGISYELQKKYKITGNLTYSKLDSKNNNDGLEDGFNTPAWAYNISVGNPSVYKQIGFTVALRHQTSFLWQSALATGIVPAYTTLDAQVNLSIFKKHLHLKMGATNLTNHYYYSFIGGSSIGGYYYGIITFHFN